MELAEGGCSASRRSARPRIPARCCPACFRRLVLDPLFSGLPESSTPIRMLEISWCKRKNMPPSMASVSNHQRRAGPPHHSLIALCLYCVTGDEPSPDVLTRLLESDRKSIRIALPQGTGDPLHAAFEIRAAHANARGSFRGHDPKKSLCRCK
jgi:hypothetical protein